MLGRTASALFWMARYVERAENMARLLEVGYRISLMPRAVEGHRDEWESTLLSAACDLGYRALYPDINSADVIHYLLFDERNPSSVKSCLRTARNNGRAVRTALTQDVWESLNATWTEFSAINPASITSDRLPVFLDWVKQRAMLYRGALIGTLLRNDTYCFSQIGTHIERADNTARILDVKYYILLPRASDVGSDLDIQQWAQVLRSVSAHRAYRWFYRDSNYRPWLVAEFLILQPQQPRSLLFCYQWISNTLDMLAMEYGTQFACHTQARAMHAKLVSDDMDRIFQTGLHEFLVDFMAQNSALSAQIAKIYNFPWGGP